MTKARIVIVEKGGPGSGHHGHAGRKGKVGGSVPDAGGGSDWGNAEMRMKAYKYLANRLADKPYEVGYIVGENGDFESSDYITSYDENKVNFSKEQAESMQGLSFIHNHPGKNSGSFSMQDVYVGMSHNLREMAVVADNGKKLYIMQFGKIDNSKIDKIWDDIKETEARIRASLVDDVIYGRKSVDDVLGLNHHLIWKDISSRYEEFTYFGGLLP